jgi:PAS domain S-box-containing protein
VTELDRDLHAQFVGEAYLPLVAHLTLLVLVLILVWSSVPPQVLVSWGGAIVGMSAVRTILWSVTRRRNLPSRNTVLMARATMLALGLAWGIGAAFVFQFLPVEDVALVLLGLTGLLAGGLATLVADRWAFSIYAVAMFVPPTVVVGVTGPGLFDELAVLLMLIYLAFAIRLHLRSHGSLRKQLGVEAALREGQRQLSEAQRIAHVGSWEWDMPTNRVTWSDELCRIYGVPPGSPAGYDEFLTRVYPADRARVKGLIEQQLADHKPLEYEWRVEQPDGGVRHVYSRQVVLMDGGGQPVRMLGTSHDITERKLAQEEVRVLRGILPICASCKRIRNDAGAWEAVESYVRARTNAEFTHGICPDCAKQVWG